MPRGCKNPENIIHIYSNLIIVTGWLYSDSESKFTNSFTSLASIKDIGRLFQSLIVFG